MSRKEDVPSSFDGLFRPIKIGNIEIKNRLVMAPVTTNYSQGGYITDQHIAFHAARARGGVGIIIVGPANNMPPGTPAHVLLALLSEREHMSAWNNLAENIQAFGARAIAQVAAGSTGRQVPPGFKAKAPSPIPITHIPPENIPALQARFEEKRGLSSLWGKYQDCPTPEQLTIDEIVWIEDAQATTVGLLKDCGFDGAELHFCHGYLGHNFLSPRNNVRSDAYGGSLENRMRFFRNTVTKARLKVGPDFVIGVRLTGNEHISGGLDIDESSKIAKTGEELGLDYIHLTGGCWEAAKWYVPDEDCTMIPEAEIIKKMVKIPVITPAIHDPVKAEAVIKGGKTDMVSLCRPLIADPDWVNKVAEGNIKKIVKCARCLCCLRRTRNYLGLRCHVNRNVGKERYMAEYFPTSAPFRDHYYIPQ